VFDIWCSSLRDDDRTCSARLTLARAGLMSGGLSLGLAARQEPSVAERIAGLRAASPAGLRAKAAVLPDYVQCNADGTLICGSLDERLGWSLARDPCGEELAKPAHQQERYRHLLRGDVP
jgi:hypothetical protein